MLLWHSRCSSGCMTKKLAKAEDQALGDEIRVFVDQLLADGAHPAKLGYALTAIAMHLGLELAPNAGVAFAVVMKAASDVAIEWADQSGTASDPRTQVSLRTTLH